MKPVLSESDFERIRARITEAERGTSGEIVPYVVARSDNYEAVVWRGAAATGTVFLMATMLMYIFYRGWSLGSLYTGIGLAVGLVASFLLGVGLVLTSEVFFRLMAGESLLARRSRARANRAFIEERIYDTKDRTGILIFVSLWEHRIEVVPDEGITQAVSPDVWDSVVTSVGEKLKRGDLAEALAAGIDACGAILRSSGLEASPDDINELDDDLRIGDA